MTAVVLGASGLVGGSLLKLLLEDAGTGRVAVLVRRPLAAAAPKLTQHVTDFSDLKALEPLLAGDDLFCCLGTTLAKAGSQAAFCAADRDLPLELAGRAAARGARRLFLVTSNGAHARSRVFYSRVKGELEEAAARLPFKAVHIFRPSLLLGKRAEPRPAERLAQAVLPRFSALLRGPLRRLRPITAEAVAAAMLKTARGDARGVHIHESDAIQDLADAKA